MKKIFITLCSLIVLLVLAFVAINARDEALNPEILPLLTWDAPSVDNNGYIYLLGFTAATDQDPLAYGEQRIQSYKDGKSESDFNFTTVEDPDNLLCKGDEQDCFAGYAEKQPGIEAMIQKNQMWLKRYNRLIHYSHFRPMVEPSLTAPAIPVGILKVQRLLIAQIAMDPANMTSRLQQDIAFWRMVLGETDDLMTKIVAINATQSDYGLLQHIITRHPELQESLQKELRPLTDREKTLLPCLDNEFSAMAKIFLELQQESKDVQSDDLWEKIVSSPVGMFFYKPNATVNLLYSFQQTNKKAIQAVGGKIATTSPGEEVEAVENTWSDFKTWSMSYNPVGKYLVNMAIPDYGKFSEKMEILDKQIKQVVAPKPI